MQQVQESDHLPYRNLMKMESTQGKAFGPLVMFMAFLALTAPSMGLSWELCDSYGSEWVTGSPHLEGKFPFYSLIFTCTGK